MRLAEKFKTELERLEVPEGAKVLVALSGGVDSMVLLHLCMDAGLEVVVAHVNYKLRGEDSDSDAALAQRVCADNNLPFYSKNAEGLSGDKGSFQDKARQFRYDWFSRIMREENARFLMTAHHLDDRVETLFMNLARGAGVKGLKSIPERNLRTLRPLLRFRKNELIAFAAEEGIEWREDASNEKDLYLRNKVRQTLIPAFEDLGDSAVEKAGEALEFLAEADGYFKRAAGKFISELETDGFICKIYDKDWDSLFDHPPLHKYVMEELGFSSSLLPQLENLRYGESGKRIEGKRFAAYRDRGCIILKASGNREVSRTWISNPLRGELSDPIVLRWQTETLPAPIQKGKKEVSLDAEKLEFPLELRRWREGDRFVPLGMEGSKKISDYLVDEKVSVPEKENVFVLVSGGEICWVVGHRISHHFRITDGSSEVVHFEAE